MVSGRASSIRLDSMEISEILSGNSQHPCALSDPFDLLPPGLGYRVLHADVLPGPEGRQVLRLSSPENLPSSSSRRMAGAKPRAYQRALP